MQHLRGCCCWLLVVGCWLLLFGRVCLLQTLVNVVDAELLEAVHVEDLKACTQASRTFTQTSKHVHPAKQQARPAKQHIHFENAKPCI